MINCEKVMVTLRSFYLKQLSGKLNNQPIQEVSQFHYLLFFKLLSHGKFIECSLLSVVISSAAACHYFFFPRGGDLFFQQFESLGLLYGKAI